MCAIFGYVSRSKSGPSVKALASIASANINRGPHSFGFAWLDAAGRLRCYKQAGRLTDHLPLLAMLKDARMLIGHLRYATHGLPSDNINNHPHPADGGWLVHNGVIRNYERLLEREGLLPVSECDSEVLGLLLERSDGKSLVRRAAESVESTDGALAMLGLWSRPQTLIVARRGNPLQMSDTPDGIYLATSGLPGKSQSLRDDTIRVFTRPTKGGVKCRTIKLNEPSETFSAGLYDEAGEYRGG